MANRFGFMPDHGKLPEVFEMCIDYLETHGLREEGILRISGQKSVIEQMKHEIEEGIKFEFTKEDKIHDVAGIFRFWLFSLPEPIIPFKMYQQFLEAASLTGKKQIITIKKLLRELTPVRFKVLERLCRLLKLISINSESNRMNVESLSIVMGPNILRPEEIKQTTDYLAESQLANNLVSILIKEYDVLLLGGSVRGERKKFSAESVKYHLESKFSKIKLGENPIVGKRHHEIHVFTPTDLEEETTSDYTSQDDSLNEISNNSEEITNIQSTDDSQIHTEENMIKEDEEENDDIAELKKERFSKPKKSQTRGRSYTNALEWLIAMQEDGKIDEMANSNENMLSLSDNRNQKKKRNNNSFDI